MIPLLLAPPKVVYRGTITGLRVSAVDGTAFIDNLPYTYTSDFSAGENGWRASKGTAAGNIDSIGGEDNWLQFTSSTVAGSHYLYGRSLTIGKKYTISLKYFIPSTNSNIDGIKFGDSAGLVSTLQNTLDTVVSVSFTFTCTETGYARVYGYDGTTREFTDAGGDDVFYIKDITISEITPYIDGNHEIYVFDSSNRFIRGVLKAAGTSETLDVELVTNGDFETDDIGESGWNPYTGTDTVALDGSIKHSGSYSLHISESNNTFPAGVRRSVTAKTQYGLYKSVFWYNIVSPSAGAGGLRGIVYNNSWSAQIITSPKYTSTSDMWLQSINYGTETLSGTNGGTSFVNDSDSIAGEFYVDDHSLKKVLTPSSSGATIVSAKQGETYNFSYKNASFTYNAASYYVIIRAIR